MTLGILLRLVALTLLGAICWWPDANATGSAKPASLPCASLLQGPDHASGLTAVRLPVETSSPSANAVFRILRHVLETEPETYPHILRALSSEKPVDPFDSDNASSLALVASTKLKTLLPQLIGEDWRNIGASLRDVMEIEVQHQEERQNAHEEAKSTLDIRVQKYELKQAISENLLRGKEVDGSNIFFEPTRDGKDIEAIGVLKNTDTFLGLYSWLPRNGSLHFYNINKPFSVSRLRKLKDKDGRTAFSFNRNGIWRSLLHELSYGLLMRENYSVIQFTHGANKEQAEQSVLFSFSGSGFAVDLNAIWNGGWVSRRTSGLGTYSALGTNAVDQMNWVSDNSVNRSANVWKIETYIPEVGAYAGTNLVRYDVLKSVVEGEHLRVCVADSKEQINGGMEIKELLVDSKGRVSLRSNSPINSSKFRLADSNFELLEYKVFGGETFMAFYLPSLAGASYVQRGNLPLQALMASKLEGYTSRRLQWIEETGGPYLADIQTSNSTMLINFYGPSVSSPNLFELKSHISFTPIFSSPLQTEYMKFFSHSGMPHLVTVSGKNHLFYNMITGEPVGSAPYLPHDNLLADEEGMVVSYGGQIVFTQREKNGTDPKIRLYLPMVSDFPMLEVQSELQFFQPRLVKTKGGLFLPVMRSKSELEVFELSGYPFGGR